MPGTTNSLVGGQRELTDVMAVLGGADSVELKLNVPETSRWAVVDALDIDPLDVQLRQVFFFDTPDQALNEQGVVVRARRVQGRGDDTVIKLRPVVPDHLPAKLRAVPEFVVEVDAMPGGFVCSASYKGTLVEPLVRPAVRGEHKLRKLFTKAQRKFYADHAPEGLEIDALQILGPVTVFKFKGIPPGFNRKVVAEMWVYPDGGRIVELSTKCRPDEPFQVAAEAKAWLASKDIDLGTKQLTKTKAALDFFTKTDPATT
jgi:hypothetical protein